MSLITALKKRSRTSIIKLLEVVFVFKESVIIILRMPFQDFLWIVLLEITRDEITLITASKAFKIMRSVIAFFKHEIGNINSQLLLLLF